MLDYRSEGPRFDPRLGHENLLRVRDTYTEKGSFLVPKILAVMMSFSVPEMSIQKDKIRF